MTSNRVSFMRGALALLVMLAAAVSAFAGTEKVLYNFTGGSDGWFPNSGVVFDRSGNLFGTTASGASGSVVFELSPSATGAWKETVIHTFSQNTEGYSPTGPLVFDQAGNLYGTTANGGLNSLGVVYQLSPGSEGVWSYKVVHNFAGNVDGGGPTGVTLDSAGTIYGTTYGGGIHAGGIAYKLVPGAGVWTESILHSFPSNPSDGSHPASTLVFDSSGNLYGATSYGGYSGSDGGTGTVFKLAYSGGSWGETILHRLSGRQDGITPSGALTLDERGNVYAATFDGPLGRHAMCGPNFGCGTIFKLTAGTGGAWPVTLLYDLPRVGGVVGLATDSMGNVYATEGLGNRILELSPTAAGGWSAKSLYNFTGDADGKFPGGSLVSDSAGNLYGTAFGGGQYGAGVVFEITP